MDVAFNVSVSVPGPARVGCWCGKRPLRVWVIVCRAPVNFFFRLLRVVPVSLPLGWYVLVVPTFPGVWVWFLVFFFTRGGGVSCVGWNFR